MVYSRKEGEGEREREQSDDGRWTQTWFTGVRNYYK